MSKRQLKIATSRKQTAKRVGKGTKLVFDDEGVAHPIYDLVPEAEFVKQWSPEEMKRQYVEENVKEMEKVDQDDREEVQAKRRQKRLKSRSAN